MLTEQEVRDFVCERMRQYAAWTRACDTVLHAFASGYSVQKLYKEFLPVMIEVAEQVEGNKDQDALIEEWKAIQDFIGQSRME